MCCVDVIGYGESVSGAAGFVRRRARERPSLGMSVCLRFLLFEQGHSPGNMLG